MIPHLIMVSKKLYNIKIIGLRLNDHLNPIPKNEMILN